MKRTLWTALAVLALAVSIPVLAQPPQGRGGFGGRGMGPGGPGGAGPLPLHELNLTDAQREQIRAIHEARRDDTPTKMRELQTQLQAAIFADPPDLAKIEELKGTIASAEAALLSARIDTELRIAQILTAEQRAKARELQGRGRSGRGGRRGSPGSGIPGFRG